MSVGDYWLTTCKQRRVGTTFAFTVDVEFHRNAKKKHPDPPMIHHTRITYDNAVQEVVIESGHFYIASRTMIENKRKVKRYPYAKIPTTRLNQEASTYYLLLEMNGYHYTLFESESALEVVVLQHELQDFISGSSTPKN